MKQRLSHFMALFFALFVSLQGFGQTDTKALTLCDYDTPDQSEAWDGFNLQNSPIVFTYAHSGSQILYQPEQLAEMKDKEITSISFKCFSYDCYNDLYTSTAKVYLQEIDDTTFPKDGNGKINWVEFNQDNVIATTELSIDFMTASMEMSDVEITFDLSKNPYKYTGKTLVVTVVNDAPEYTEGTIQFYWIKSKKEDPWRSLIYGSDSKDFLTNQSSDLVLNGNEDKWKNAPAVKFTYQETAAPEPPAPSNGKVTLGHFEDGDHNAAWDGFNLQNAPVIMAYGHSGSQVLYQPEQLADMKGKEITSMSFKCFSEDCYKDGYTSTMKLYLQEIDNKEFVYDETSELYYWYEFDENDVASTLEFTGDFLTAYGEDMEIKFDLSKKPFVYTGKTLLVTVVNDAPECIDPSEGTIRFYWVDSQNGDPWKSFVYASDDTDFITNQNKNLALKAIENEDKWKNAPAVQFVYQDASEQPIPPAASDFSGGEGSMEKPYLISNVEDLSEMNVWTNEGKTTGVYFKLTNDIEDAFTEFIGTQANFKGHFDGDYHCVNLDINQPEMDYVGLFGCIEGGSLKNLQVKGNVVGRYYVGGPAGQIALGTTVENVINYSNVTANMFGGGVTGQIISMDGAPACVLSQCANYGTVISTYAGGGIIGDCGQQVGNVIERIANYGHVDCPKYTGGLIGNARAYDQIYFGLNFGTAESEKVQGCIGNTKSSTYGDLYFDKQMFNRPDDNSTQAKYTSDLIGSSMKSTETGNGFSEEYWLYTENLYPRLKMNGMENSDMCVLYATPVMLTDDNTLDFIDNPFTVVTENGVKWSSKNGNITFEGNTATPVIKGEDVLTATLNGCTRKIKVYVDIVDTGINDMQESATNTVTAHSGYVIFNLAENAMVEVMEISGNIVMMENLAAGHHSFELPAGIYIVRVNNETDKICVSK